MKSSSFPPPSIASVFADIAGLNEDAFNVLASAVSDANVFDTQSHRVQNLAALMEAESEAVRLQLDALHYMYAELHKTDLGSVPLEQVLRSYLEAVGFDEELNETNQAETSGERAIRLDAAVSRLSGLLKKTENAVRYEKYLRLIDGPVPLAISFVPILDLRPIMKNDNTQLDQFIPLIQLKIRTNRKDVAGERVLQLDRRALRHLREAIDLADTMLRSMKDHPDIADLMTEIDS